jgi:PIN domain nuclease of toxin-antitoxin system
MRLLLDTHIYIWVAEGNKRLSNRARDVIQQAETVYDGLR